MKMKMDKLKRENFISMTRKVFLGAFMVWIQSSVYAQIEGLDFDGPNVVVNAEEYYQEFIGIGGAVSYYSRYNGLTEDQREEMLKILAVDLNLKFAKNYVGEVPANDPEEYANSVKFWSDLKRYNPDINFQLTVNNVPDHLEGNANEGHDPDIPGVLDSMALYYFKALEHYHINDLTVLQLDVLNERGLSEKLTDLFDIGIDKLREIINDPEKNPNGVPMPQVCGPSTWSAASPVKWIEDWKANRPNAWNNVDVVTTHGYQNGTFENYKAIFDVAEGKPFYNNEQTGKIQDDEGTGANAPDDLAKQWVSGEEPDYIGDVSIAKRMSDVINAGGNSFFPFRLANNRPNNAALMAMNGDGTYDYGSIYFGAKHLSSIQADSARRVGHTATETDEYRVVTFRKPGEDTVVVHITNVWGNTGFIKIGVGDGTKAYGIKSVEAWKTDESLDFEKIINKSYVSSINAIDFEVTPHSVNSFKFVIDPNGYQTARQEQIIGTASIEDATVGEVITLTASSDAQLEVKYELIAGSATLVDDQLTVDDYGPIEVKAFNEGDDNFFAASVDFSFCGLPAKPSITQSGTTLTSSSIEDNLWYFNGGKLSGEAATQQTLEISEEGTYQVLVGKDGCFTASDEFEATILGAEEAIENWLISSEEGLLHIVSINRQKIASVGVYDLNGRHFYQESEIGKNQLKISLSGLSKGIYILKIIGSDKTQLTRKFIKY